MLAVEGLSKSYGSQVLFEKISFRLNRGERVGVVGKNGHGKSTLFRLIAGLEEPDEGRIIIPKNYRIGYLQQEADFKGATVLEEASRGLSSPGADQLWRVEKVLSGLGFFPLEFQLNPFQLSGGYQVRLNLARLLLTDYDLLLLDEPNNYLDITSIRWLEKFLLDWPGELMLITHDRSFMDRIATHILGLHRHKARKIEGNTEKYYDQIAQEEEVYEKTRINDERKRKEMEVFINRFRAKARLAGLVQSRLKYIEKMGKREKLEKIKNMEFAFQEKPFHHKYALSLDGVSFGYIPDKPIIDRLSFQIGARDRVMVIGRNGRGKTTLLKVMASLFEPQTGGITYSRSVAVGYYEQSYAEEMNNENTVLEEIALANPRLEPVRVRQIAGTLMFEGDEALKPIRVLSGGEKSRVLLGKILARPINLLLLDEPTNHLDLESSDALLAALDNFEGAVVMVTHNEMFLRALAERLIVFQDNKIDIFEGDYESFLKKVGWSEEKVEKAVKNGFTEKNGKVISGVDHHYGQIPGEGPSPAAAPYETPFRFKLSPRELRRLRSEVIIEKSRNLKPLEERVSGLENSIEETEERISQLTQKIIDASVEGCGQEVVRLSRNLDLHRHSLDSLYEEYAQVYQEYEEKKEIFERRLEELDKISS
ncbi:MAG TPA: ATP-binding cassette domain-containing protein [Candidatus Saccharicenans sp.]|jgi:ATP-binding cassette subfamily F protein 3|nr:ATP-binding cassette domain-containing protein [Candidatus Saccharicenans sp.]HRD02136.1 ATP-binding cassette domain-containing protein [Candidatus Saccharicenans sp.]